MNIHIIGINDRSESFSNEITHLISSCRNFAGGKRHYSIVSGILPQKHSWVNILAPLENLFSSIAEAQEDWVIFASGDPLFFGIGNTLSKKFPQTPIKIYPAFNALQLLAHRFNLPYGKFTTISLTGRPWQEFDKALITGEPRMGILTDRNKTPAVIAKRMLKYNYHNYLMYYGEHLGGDNETVKRLTIEEAANFEGKHPNCIFIEKTNQYIPQKGISEKDFVTLPGRPNMITKLSIRLTTLALMDLHNKTTFWDIGACSGSISVEAKLNYPHLIIHAFEIREESNKIMDYNFRKFQTPGISKSINNFVHIEKEEMERPDCVFLGGHNNQMEGILEEVDRFLLPEGVIGFNSVKEESKERFLNWCKNRIYRIISTNRLMPDEHNPVHILIAQKASN